MKLFNKQFSLSLGSALVLTILVGTPQQWDLANAAALRFQPNEPVQHVIKTQYTAEEKREIAKGKRALKKLRKADQKLERSLKRLNDKLARG